MVTSLNVVQPLLVHATLQNTSHISTAVNAQQPPLWLLAHHQSRIHHKQLNKLYSVPTAQLGAVHESSEADMQTI